MSLTPAQLEERRAGLGASDAAPAVGLSHWQTPLQLYLEKIGAGQPQDEDDTLHLEMGQALEPMILARFAKRQRVSVSDQQKKFVDPTWSQRWATVDGIASDGGLVEAKSAAVADPEAWGDEFTEDAVPMQYLLQTQHALACTGLRFAWIPLVIINRRQFKVYRVRRDEELIALLTEQEREFMRMVEARTPPPPRTLEDAKRLWPHHVSGKRLQASADIAEGVRLLKQTKGEIKALEVAKEQLELTLKTVMGDAAELVYSDHVVCSWKQARPSRRFNEDAFARAYPDRYREFLFEVPGSRRFLTP